MSITKNNSTTVESAKRKSVDPAVDDGLFFTKKSKRLDESQPEDEYVPSPFHYNMSPYKTEILKLLDGDPEFILENLEHNLMCFKKFDAKMPVISVLGSKKSGKSKLITHLGHFINCPIQPSTQSPLNATGCFVYHSRVFEHENSLFPVTAFLEFAGTDHMFETKSVASSVSKPIMVLSDSDEENHQVPENNPIEPDDSMMRDYYTSLSTLISDVVIIVTDSDPNVQGNNFSLLKQHCSTLSTNMKLMKKKRMLIVVYNKYNCGPDQDNIEATSLFLKNNDQTGIIREVFNTIKCVYLPDTTKKGNSIGLRWEQQVSLIRSFILHHVSTRGANATPKEWYRSLPVTLRRLSFPFECILSHLKKLFYSIFPSDSNSLELFCAARKYTFLALSRCFVVYLIHNDADMTVSLERWKPQITSYCQTLWHTLKDEQLCAFTRENDTCSLRYHNHGDKHKLSSGGIWTFFKDIITRSLAGTFVDSNTEITEEHQLEALIAEVFNSIQSYSEKSLPELHDLTEELIDVCFGDSITLEDCDYHLCPSADHSCHRCWRLNNEEKEHVWVSESAFMCDSELELLLPTESKLYYCQSCLNDRDSKKNQSQVIVNEAHTTEKQDDDCAFIPI